MELIECPLCESDQVQLGHPTSADCPTCGYVLEEWFLETRSEIASLQDAFGTHACECGHPQMRRLPDGTYWCPACGEEVLPLVTNSALWEFRNAAQAYRQGWLDGYLNKTGSFTSNAHLATWEAARDRLDYYRGHREGSRGRRLEHSDLSESTPEEIPALKAS